MNVSRGDVVVVRLDPTEGSEIRKTRPAVVLSNNAACLADAVLQVVPLTRMPDRKLCPYEALITPESSGVSKPLRAVANQLRTVVRHRVVEKLGSITEVEREAVERAVRVQLGLD